MRGFRQRAYEEPWVFVAYNVQDQFNTWNLEDRPYAWVLNFGPVFPFFLEADFSVYSGFREFTNLFGLRGFAKFDTRRDYSLEETLKKPPAIITEAYLKKTFEHLRNPLVHHQSAMRQVCYVHFPETRGTWGDLKINHLEANVSVNSALRGYWYSVEDPCFSPDEFASPVPDEIVKEARGLKREYDSIIARCYAEIFEASRLEKKLKPCANCGRLFISRPNQSFCHRLDPNLPRIRLGDILQDRNPSSRLAKNSLIQRFDTLQPPEELGLKKLTCQARGRQNTFKNRLNKDKVRKAAFDEKKKRQNHLYYLKRKLGEEAKEYQEARAEFEKWKRANKTEPRGKTPQPPKGRR